MLIPRRPPLPQVALGLPDQVSRIIHCVDIKYRSFLTVAGHCMGGGIRTHNRQFWRLLLWPIELHPYILLFPLDGCRLGFVRSMVQRWSQNKNRHGRFRGGFSSVARSSHEKLRRLVLVPRQPEHAAGDRLIRDVVRAHASTVAQAVGRCARAFTKTFDRLPSVPAPTLLGHGWCRTRTTHRRWPPSRCAHRPTG